MADQLPEWPADLNWSGAGPTYAEQAAYYEARADTAIALLRRCAGLITSMNALVVGEFGEEPAEAAEIAALLARIGEVE